MRAFIYGLTFLCLAGALSSSSSADVYVGGHADLGVGFENGNLHLHLHAENTLSLFGGGTSPAGEYEPSDLIIGVPTLPGEPIGRPAGAQWDFLAANAGNPVWFLPQGNTPGKPFLGIGTEELTPATGWTSPLTWTFNSITTVSGSSSQFALWQNDSFGNPVVLASTLIPTSLVPNSPANSWTQSAFSHDHFNFGFTGEGVYDVSLTIRGANAGVAPIAAGNYTDTATFRFATGNAIASVPEPSGALLLGLAAVGSLFRRRRGRE